MNYKTARVIGRIALTVSFLSLIGAWLNQNIGFSPFGMSQEHLFNDATVLALLGIGMLIDAVLHRQDRQEK